MLAILHRHGIARQRSTSSPGAPMRVLDVLLGSPPGRTRPEGLLVCMNSQYVAAYS